MNQQSLFSTYPAYVKQVVMEGYNRKGNAYYGCICRLDGPDSGIICNGLFNEKGFSITRCEEIKGGGELTSADVLFKGYQKGTVDIITRGEFRRAYTALLQREFIEYEAVPQFEVQS